MGILQNNQNRIDDQSVEAADTEAVNTEKMPAELTDLGKLLCRICLWLQLQ